MFQAVVAGCILINFFIYDPLLYFLKKLAGAKNLLDLHALGRGSDVRYTQECIKMKRSQSLQKVQAPQRSSPGSRQALRVVSQPVLHQVCRVCLLPPLSHDRLLRGASEDPGGRWWP